MRSTPKPTLSKPFLEIATWLIEHGADVNAKSEDTWKTPLLFAAEYNDIEMGMLLLNHNADLSIRTNKRSHSKDVVKSPTGESVSPFMMAESKYNWAFMAMLSLCGDFNLDREKRFYEKDKAKRLNMIDEIKGKLTENLTFFKKYTRNSQDLIPQLQFEKEVYPMLRSFPLFDLKDFLLTLGYLEQVQQDKKIYYRFHQKPLYFHPDDPTIIPKQKPRRRELVLPIAAAPKTFEALDKQLERVTGSPEETSIYIQNRKDMRNSSAWRASLLSIYLHPEAIRPALTSSPLTHTMTPEMVLVCHIFPYEGEKYNQAVNGIVLRRDLARLFRQEKQRFFGLPADQQVNQADIKISKKFIGRLAFEPTSKDYLIAHFEPAWCTDPRNKYYRQWDGQSFKDIVMTTLDPED